MRLRIRGPSGTSTVTLDDDATVSDLLSQIKEKTSLAKFDIKYGYPPKPLTLESKSTLLTNLAVKLNGEQLTISSKEDSNESAATEPQPHKVPEARALTSDQPAKQSFSGLQSNTPISSQQQDSNSSKPIALQHKAMEGEVPEIPIPSRGATLVLRVMPDDNSCLFRAFGTAVLPGDDLTMTELRSLVASTIQDQPDIYSTVVLEKKPDEYCRWIQTEDAWGGGIEMSILSKHFEIEICSIDVQSLRIDRFNEGAPSRCILVYSGIHYDTIVQSPSEPPHLKADNPPELDKRIWDNNDEEILEVALELCKKLQAKHYYTDTGGMTIKCNICGWTGNGEKDASVHASQTGHYDMEEVVN